MFFFISSSNWNQKVGQYRNAEFFLPVLRIRNVYSGSNPYNLNIFGIKKHLKFNQKEETKKKLPTICHLLFHCTILQYTQSRIHRPNIYNNNN